jgi:hypothetical protein
MERLWKRSQSGIRMQPEVWDSEPERFSCSVWKNLSIVIFFDQATADVARRISRFNQQMILHYPMGHSNVTFVVNDIPPPSPDAHEGLASIFDSKISRINCMAIVLEGVGFWASAIRSSVTTWRMESRSDIALRVYTSIDEVVDWLPTEHQQRTGLSIDPHTLKAALEQTRFGERLESDIRYPTKDE